MKRMIAGAFSAVKEPSKFSNWSRKPESTAFHASTLVEFTLNVPLKIKFRAIFSGSLKSFFTSASLRSPKSRIRESRLFGNGFESASVENAFSINVLMSLCCEVFAVPMLIPEKK